MMGFDKSYVPLKISRNFHQDESEKTHVPINLIETYF